MADNKLQKDLANIVEDLTEEVKKLKAKDRKYYLNSFVTGVINGAGKIIGMVIILALVGWYLSQVDFGRSIDQAIINIMGSAAEQVEENNNQ